MTDVKEMRNAMLRALNYNKEEKIPMKYTQIYNAVYESLQRDRFAHEELHYAAIKITDAVWELHIQCNDGQALPETSGTVVDSILKILQ